MGVLLCPNQVFSCRIAAQENGSKPSKSRKKSGFGLGRKKAAEEEPEEEEPEKSPGGVLGGLFGGKQVASPRISFRKSRLESSNPDWGAKQDMKDSQQGKANTSVFPHGTRTSRVEIQNAIPLCTKAFDTY